MKLCNASGIVYTNIGTEIPFSIENEESARVAATIEGIKDFYAHKTKFNSMYVKLGNLIVDLTQTIAVCFTMVEEF